MDSQSFRRRSFVNRFSSLSVIIACCCVLSVAITTQQNAHAVPACPDAAVVMQPDGTQFKMNLFGDEFFSWQETQEGYVIAKDSADGFWKYASPAKDKASFETIPGAIVGAVNPAQLGLKKGVLPPKDSLQKHQRKAFLMNRPLPAQATEQDKEFFPADITPGDAEIPVSGTLTIKNIVLLACFDDHWNSGAGTVSSSYGRTNTTEYVNLFNEVGHTADGAVGSVRDYYYEVSYGKLTVQSVVSAWVKLPQNEAYYGTDGGTKDTNWQQMISDAINAADTAGFDFSQGDSDGDGWVDCLTVIHSGHGQEVSGNPTTCIWSKQGAMTSVVTVDGVKMYRCHTEPALRGATSSTSIIRIGVICHEMAHFFGLPDLYDYSGLTNGVGDWGLMASGSWNGTLGHSPAHLCCWSKYMLGFVRPSLVHSQASIPISRVEDIADQVHMLRDGLSNNEYFLVENRSKRGFDNTASIFNGLLIYHVDAKSNNNDLGTWAHPVVKIEEADGNNSLGSKTAESEAGDVWTSTSGLAGGFRDQTGNLSTNAMVYQPSHYYNRANNSSYYTYNTLSSFSTAGSTMSYTATTLKSVVGSFPTSFPSYTVTWGACTNATHYGIEEGQPVTLNSFSDGAESEDDMYANWNISGTVTRDNGGAQAGSYSYAMHYYYNSKFYSPVQSITMRNSFKLKSTTVVSFYYVSHLVSGNGYLKCQISNDAGNTWKTLGTYSGYVDAFSYQSFNQTAISALGIALDDDCIIRFVTNVEYGSGWNWFPGYGFAVDTISVTGTEISSYGNWVSLDNNVPTNSFLVSGKNDGTYPYRVRAYSNSVWQGYGATGVVTVVGTEVPTWWQY